MGASQYNHEIVIDIKKSIEESNREIAKMISESELVIVIGEDEVFRSKQKK